MEQQTGKSRMARLLKSFEYAGRGLLEMIRSQMNARIELFILTVVMIAGFVFKIRVNEWITIILVSGLVLAAEAFNSAIENLANAISLRQFDSKIKKIKDLAASGVLISAVCAFVIGLIIFIPYIVRFFVSL
ncbi:MAG TPA: diacylglycerol kinase family protein [Bacteroidales bacterium]|jgi:diacylglycerol kinase (ATP)|nr:diacylglycerol kinase family protein [Bacteroidales bacterium]